MTKTALEIGSLVVISLPQHGKHLFVLTGSKDDCLLAGVQRPIEPGEVIYQVVRKNDPERLEERRSYTVKPGDVEWMDSGVRIGGTAIWKNFFSEATPGWLNEAR